MNTETLNLIERPYQEVVDDILTAIVGGVVNEPIIFDLKEDAYPLAQGASDVRSITGTVSVKNDAGVVKAGRFTFQKEVDFIFDDGTNAVIWQPGGTKPDDETIFQVDYLRPDSRSPLSDTNVGSVMRTLSEAIGREIATVYEQINQAYRSGFIDTAQGQALDLVVAILGVKRKTKEFAEGLVTFFRNPAAGDGNITIPGGVEMRTEKGEATFVTIESRTLQRGQTRIDVRVRAGDDSRGEKGLVAAGAITTLAQPITGISRVTNFEAMTRGAEDETDEQLKARAKAALRALSKATLAALAKVIFEGNAVLTEAFDPNGPPAKRTAPGTVTLLIESEPERLPSLRAGIEETRAAGVQATLVARYVYIRPRAHVRITSGLPDAGKEKVAREIIQAMQAYVDGLSAGDPAKGEELLKAIKSVKDVSPKPEETKIVDVIVSLADVGQPGPETLVSSLAEAAVKALGNATGAYAAAQQAALEGAIGNVLSQSDALLPSVRKIADRSRLQGLSGQPATDQEIESGKFQVAAIVNAEKWWIVLEVEPTDLLLAEA